MEKASPLEETTIYATSSRLDVSLWKQLLIPQNHTKVVMPTLLTLTGISASLHMLSIYPHCLLVIVSQPWQQLKQSRFVLGNEVSWPLAVDPMTAEFISSTLFQEHRLLRSIAIHK